MVKIRLSQTGTTNRKTYRVVAIEEGKRRNGSAIEILGHYNPLVKPAELIVDRARVEYFMSKGAQMTDIVKKLLKEK
jgi:small subunit ribosomal protein S16